MHHRSRVVPLPSLSLLQSLLPPLLASSSLQEDPLLPGEVHRHLLLLAEGTSPAGSEVIVPQAARLVKDLLAHEGLPHAEARQVTGALFEGLGAPLEASAF